jgi:biopolymer transport protein ExbD
VQVVLMPGRNVKYENIVAVYEAALRAGFTKVGFATSH